MPTTQTVLTNEYITTANSTPLLWYKLTGFSRFLFGRWERHERFLQSRDLYRSFSCRTPVFFRTLASNWPWARWLCRLRFAPLWYLLFSYVFCLFWWPIHLVSFVSMPLSTQSQRHPLEMLQVSIWRIRLKRNAAKCLVFVWDISRVSRYLTSFSRQRSTTTNRPLFWISCHRFRNSFRFFFFLLFFTFSSPWHSIMIT